VGASQRKRDLRQRRSRQEKLTKLKAKLPKATQSEKTEIARKLRNLTPGAEELIDRWKLVESDREACRERFWHAAQAVQADGPQRR
jgi:hypothetical protein